MVGCFPSLRGRRSEAGERRETRPRTASLRRLRGYLRFFALLRRARLSCPAWAALAGPLSARLAALRLPVRSAFRSAARVPGVFLDRLFIAARSAGEVFALMNVRSCAGVIFFFLPGCCGIAIPQCGDDLRCRLLNSTTANVTAEAGPDNFPDQIRNFPQRCRV